MSEQRDIIWTDDKIRWTEDNDKLSNTGGEKEEEEVEECAFIDPFKDPDPFETFCFNYCNEDNHSVEVSVRGYKTEADAVWQSTGLTLWQASNHLCRYMVDHRDMFHEKRILELGAGLGLCGILAHHLGRNCTVYITDGDSDALVHLRKNVKLNQQKVGASASADDKRMVTAAQLLWGQDTTEMFLEKHEESVQTFDMLIASDIIYALVIVEPLWETVKLLLRKSKEAVFIMAYAKRDVPVTIDMVLEAAGTAGFSHALVDENPEGIWVYEFRWKEEMVVIL